MEISEKVKELCKARGVTFKELAERLGVTDIWLRSSLKRNPTVATLERIAGGLGVPVWRLLVSPEEVTPPSPSVTCPQCGARINVAVTVMELPVEG